MAKKKSKVVKSGKSKQVVNAKKAKRYADRHPKMNYAFWTFINLLLIVIFIYGLYRMWKYSWTDGLSIIVFDLIVILILKLGFKLWKR